MKKIILLFLPFVFISCQKYIDMEIPDSGRKLTLNCFLNDKDSNYVELSKSVFILDNTQPQMLTGAIIQLFENDLPVGTFNENGSNYLLPGFKPTQGHEYSIKATLNDLSVSAKSSIPNLVPFTFSDTMRITKENQEYLRVKLNMVDPENEKNYYMLHFSVWRKYEGIENDKYTIYFNSDDKIFETFSNDGYGIFSDALFNGKSKNLICDFESYNFYDEENFLIISLYSISKEVYFYLKTYEAQKETSFSPFAEPVIVFNNISGGYGIFGGYTNTEDTVIIPMMSSGYIEEKH